MTFLRRATWFLALAVCVSGNAIAQVNQGVFGQPPTGTRGTIEFVMNLDQAYGSGLQVKPREIRLLEIPGLGSFTFRVRPASSDIVWSWSQREPYRDVVQGFPEWPGPGEHHVLLTWDSERAIVDLYLNGVRTRERGARFREVWSNPSVAEGFRVFEDSIRVGAVSANSEFLDEAAVRKRVPALLLDQTRHLLEDFNWTLHPIGDGESMKHELLHEVNFSKPSDLEGWVMEGAGAVEVEGEWMHMRSLRPDGGEAAHGHFVHWAPWTLPNSFVAEWEVKLESDDGLLIAFFAASGPGGSSIFDSGLRKRDGTFGHYTNGDITCYHISYYSNPIHEPGRTTSNVRKNPPSLLVFQGPIGIPAGSRAVHAVQLVKVGNLVQLSVDGRVVVNWRDDRPERHGAAYGPGAFGLRQMQWTQAAYRNLRIWSVEAPHPTVSR